MVTSILLPLQWGGNTKPWSDGSVIATFCVVRSVLRSFYLTTRYNLSRIVWSSSPPLDRLGVVQGRQRYPAHLYAKE
jgi:hypothetical protein